MRNLTSQLDQCKPVPACGCELRSARMTKQLAIRALGQAVRGCGIDDGGRGGGIGARPRAAGVQNRCVLSVALHAAMKRQAFVMRDHPGRLRGLGVGTNPCHRALAARQYVHIACVYVPAPSRGDAHGGGVGAWAGHSTSAAAGVAMRRFGPGPIWSERTKVPMARICHWMESSRHSASDVCTSERTFSAWTAANQCPSVLSGGRRG